MPPGVRWPTRHVGRWTPEIDERSKRKAPGSAGSSNDRAHVYRRLPDTPSAEGASPVPSTLPYNSPQAPGSASTIGYSPLPVSPQQAPVLPTIGDEDDFVDAESEYDTREFDDKDSFYVNDLNGVAALEGLDGVRAPPDPLHYVAGISSVHDSFYDVSMGNAIEPVEVHVSGYLRHWYTGIAEFMNVVDDPGAVVRRSTGVDAIHAGRDSVMRFYGKGRPEAVIEREMNVLIFEEALAHVEECTEAMRDELKRWSSCNGFRRHPRNFSQNILDSRWVLTWKLVEANV
jgi:hypothetical protein